MSGPSTAKEKLATLRKRADWLEKRIGRAEAEHGAGNVGFLSYDRAELSALRWAIAELSEGAA